MVIEHGRVKQTNCTGRTEEIHGWNLEVCMGLGKKLSLPEHGQPATNADGTSEAETQVNESSG